MTDWNNNSYHNWPRHLFPLSVNHIYIENCHKKTFAQRSSSIFFSNSTHQRHQSKLLIARKAFKSQPYCRSKGSWKIYVHSFALSDGCRRTRIVAVTVWRRESADRLSFVSPPPFCRLECTDPAYLLSTSVLPQWSEPLLLLVKRETPSKLQHCSYCQKLQVKWPPGEEKSPATVRVWSSQKLLFPSSDGFVRNKNCCFTYHFHLVHSAIKFLLLYTSLWQVPSPSLSRHSDNVCLSQCTSMWKYMH